MTQAPAPERGNQELVRRLQFLETSVAQIHQDLESRITQNPGFVETYAGIVRLVGDIQKAKASAAAGNNPPEGLSFDSLLNRADAITSNLSNEIY